MTSKTAWPIRVAVADAHLVVGQPLDGEVLPQEPWLEVVTAEHLRPVTVGVELVDQDGAVLPTVAGEVALAVPLDVEPTHHPRPGHRVFPRAGVDGAVVPLDFLGKPTFTDVRIAITISCSGVKW